MGKSWPAKFRVSLPELILIIVYIKEMKKKTRRRRSFWTWNLFTGKCCCAYCFHFWGNVLRSFHISKNLGAWQPKIPEQL
jgi:hypothetical protein